MKSASISTNDWTTLDAAPPSGYETLMHRVAIIGPCGAGKSTLARQIAPLLDLPLIHLDAEYWLPGWTEPPKPIWRLKCEQLHARDKWIIDGNYGDTMEARLAAADAIIFLDLPRWRCVWRVIKRVARHHGRTRPDMGAGCPEKWDWPFMEYVWTYHQDHRPKILQRLERVGAEGQAIIVLRSQDEIDEFVKELATRGNS